MVIKDRSGNPEALTAGTTQEVLTFVFVHNSISWLQEGLVLFKSIYQQEELQHINVTLETNDHSCGDY